MSAPTPSSKRYGGEDLTTWLRAQCGHDSRSVPDCGHCEAADKIERARRPMVITEDTARHIDKFTELSVEHYEAGSTDKAGWEHVRSYAVEALQGLLSANPAAFTYGSRMQAVAEKKQEVKRNG